MSCSGVGAGRGGTTARTRGDAALGGAVVVLLAAGAVLLAAGAALGAVLAELLLAGALAVALAEALGAAPAEAFADTAGFAAGAVCELATPTLESTPRANRPPLTT